LSPDSRIEKTLRALASAGSVEAASKKLGVPPWRVRLYAAGLAGNGLARIRRGEGKCDCSSCPLASLCGAPTRRRPS